MILHKFLDLRLVAFLTQVEASSNQDILRGKVKNFRHGQA